MPLELHMIKRRHVCSVHGCRNRDCYLVSRSSEHINSIYLCGDCIRTMCSLLSELEPPEIGMSTAAGGTAITDTHSGDSAARIDTSSTSSANCDKGVTTASNDAGTYDFKLPKGRSGATPRGRRARGGETDGEKA